MRRNLSVSGVVLSYLVVFGLSGFLFQASSAVVAKNSMWQQFNFNSAAGSRPYFVYTPANYDLGRAIPLVVMLHGCTQSATNFALGTKMNQLADQYQFIVVYPQQLNVDNQSLCWNWFESSNQVRGHGEPAIIAGIVQAVEQNTSEWSIDKNRIYVAGFSAGAAMAVILGATYPDIFAAIGVHSGLEYQAATSSIDSLKVMSQGGPDPRQKGLAAFNAMGLIPHVIPTIVFQGTSDLVDNPINGDLVTQQWMKTDQLASHGSYKADFSNPSNSSNGAIPGGHSFRVFQWNDQGKELQEYWKIEGMGHAWSGGNIGNFDTDPSGPDASLSMLRFFMGHTLENHMVCRVNAIRTCKR